MDKPFVVGIAGGSASGKTTLCKMLEEQLGDFKVSTLHMDDYYKPDKKRPYTQSFLSGKYYIDDNHPDSINLYLFKKDLDYAQKQNFDIIIAEGLFVLLDEEIRKKLDLKLYVDCRSDERILRRVSRNMSFGQSFDEIKDVYLDLVRFRHDEYVAHTKWVADIICNGSVITETGVSVIAEFIKSKIS